MIIETISVEAEMIKGSVIVTSLSIGEAGSVIAIVKVEIGSTSTLEVVVVEASSETGHEIVSAGSEAG